MDKSLYDFKNWMAKRQRTWKPFNPESGTKIELDHVIGRKAADLLLALPKNWHDFKSSRQDSLNTSDKNHALIMALESIAAMLDLCAAMLRWICFQLREKP